MGPLRERRSSLNETRIFAAFPPSLFLEFFFTNTVCKSNDETSPQNSEHSKVYEKYMKYSQVKPASVEAKKCV